MFIVEKEFFGSRIHLTFLDVINFGHAMNAEASFSVLLDFIESRYKEYLEEETRIKKIQSLRIIELMSCCTLSTYWERTHSFR